MFWLDHVVAAVADLEQAAAVFLERYGLASYEGGRHAGLGTANRIVPLGREYVELLGVVDHEAAAVSPIGNWIADEANPSGRLASWCLGTDDLDGIARRIGGSPQSLRRIRPDGVKLSWRSVGFERAMDFPGLPFFISWNVRAADHPGRTPVEHPVEVSGVSSILLGGESARLEEWLGEHSLPVRFSGGPPGIESISIATAAGTIEIP